MKKHHIPFVILFTVLLIDQVSKIIVKTNMMLGEEFKVLGDWFCIHFTENNGMAFGFEFAGEYGKLFLTLFRIVAVIAIAYYLFQLVKKDMPKGFIASVSLILAGAIGNIIDSVFYGVIFNESYYQLASLFPEGGGYSTLLHGRVVDMLYFPVINTHLPDWFPFWGGRHFIFFRPIFNVADTAITTGVFTILFFQKTFFKDM